MEPTIRLERTTCSLRVNGRSVVGLPDAAFSTFAVRVEIQPVMSPLHECTVAGGLVIRSSGSAFAEGAARLDVQARWLGVTGRQCALRFRLGARLIVHVEPGLHHFAIVLAAVHQPCATADRSGIGSPRIGPNRW